MSSAGSTRVVPALPPAVRKRLVDVLAWLGSDFDGEHAAVALLASLMLWDRGLTWNQVVAEQQQAERLGADDASADLDLCRRHVACLNPWQQGFVSGITQQSRPLSLNERAKLAEAAAALRARGLA